MKEYIAILLLLLSFNLGAQDLNGEYISNETSFKSEVNPKENFTELTRFNIAVQIQNDNTDGRIVIHDQRLPEKLLIYKILSLLDVVELDNYEVTIYECKAEHIDEKEKIIFYSDRKNLRLMVRNDSSSQVFHNLKKVN